LFLLNLFFFGGFIFRRNRIQYSWRFDLFLIFAEGGYIDGLSFVLIESFLWIF
jgi:hypothetical protein